MKQDKTKKKQPKPVQTKSLKKHTRSLKETGIIYAVGTIISIYFGFLCGAVWVSGNSFNEFLINFNDFILVKHHFIVGVTEATLPFIGIYWVMFSLVFIMLATRFEHPFAGQEFGVAKWGNAKDFTRDFANHDEEAIVEVNTGNSGVSEVVKVNTKNYWLAENVYLSIDNVKTSNLNMLVVGPPGSGKSFRLARPILSQLCGNFLATDPKGELYKQTGQYFEDNGYEVMVMNVESEEGMPMSIRFNPFAYIRTESDIMSIAGILMKSTTPQDEAGGGNDQFFEQSAEVLLISIIFLIHYYFPKEEQNWKTFVKLLDATTVYTNKDGSIDNREGGILDIATTANLKWKDTHDSSFPGYVAIEKFYNGAAETTSSIVASLDAHCRYMKLSCVVDLLSEDEIHIGESFGYSRKSEASSTGKRILFIVTSEDKRYYDWIPSMVYSLFFDELYHLTAIDPTMHETLPQHLTFLMDEFANVTLPDSFVEKLSTMRSRNMSAVIIVQNLIQLKRKFPKFDMDKDLIGNCSIIDILGAPDMDSCEYLSKHFGTQTIHKASDSDAKDYKGQSSRSEDVMQKSLLSAEDIFAMSKDGECAIVIKGTDPLYEPKCKMEVTPFLKLLCRKNKPYDPKKRKVEREKGKTAEPFFFAGEDAYKKASILREKGTHIVSLSMNDIENMVIAGKLREATTVLKMTEDMQKTLHENHERYLEEHCDLPELDYEQYRDEGPFSEESQKKFQNRCLVVTELDSAGYTRQQIKLLHKLIMEDFEAERIMKIIPPSSEMEKIKNLTKNF
ncbi:MAG TPA: type IV secretory system conjugative DNA transfer family protein [Lachnospiraceae bacterium]|nr:type IV secretory system conjugative DNA transfer family protein [Lachnospiraceae bacterium]